LIHEGNQPFKQKDAFTGVEKFRQGMAKYEELKENDKILELLNKLTKKFGNKLHDSCNIKFINYSCNIKFINYIMFPMFYDWIINSHE